MIDPEFMNKHAETIEWLKSLPDECVGKWRIQKACIPKENAMDDTKFRFVIWDWKSQPHFDEINNALEIFDHPVIREVDNDLGDFYVVVVCERTTTQEDAQALWSSDGWTWLYADEIAEDEAYDRREKDD